jgi:hypothetical protein
MTREAGRNIPAMQCDYCSEPLLFIAMGAVVFPRDVETGGIGAIRLVHQGNCLDQVEAALIRADALPGSMDLAHYLRQLVRSGQLDPPLDVAR